MDSLSHALAGALVADALPFTRRLGGGAALIAALAAAAPDLDMIPAFAAKFPPASMEFGDLFDMGLIMRFHRAYTHSFFIMALAAIPLGLLAWKWSGGKGKRLHWISMLALALFSHTILDITNPWGVRAWLPFSQARPAWGILPLTDPFTLAVLLAVFAANHILRDGHSGAGRPESKCHALREKTARFLDAHVGVTTVGLAGVALVAGRMAQAALMR